jgi:outer membrane immunogenic protein
MKKFLLTTAAFAALATAPAMAADLAVKAPLYKAPPPPPLYSWTGCYVGGHVGGLWSRKDWVDRDPFSPTFGEDDGSHNPSGFIGGVQGGCDYQFTPGSGFVIGIAGDFAWTNASASNASILFPGFTNSSRVNNLSSVTGRVGYAWDRFLGYVKGGGAWERDDHWFTDGFFTGTASVTRSGWTVGVGGEYAFTNYLSGFIEYDHYDFGRSDIAFAETFGGTFTYGIRDTKDVVKAGLNLRFGPWFGGPVVARY